MFLSNGQEERGVPWLLTTSKLARGQRSMLRTAHRRDTGDSDVSKPPVVRELSCL